MSTQEKFENLKEYLQNLGRVAVAFSYGVDSTLLLKAAQMALGSKNVIAVTAKPHSFPERELREAEEYCRSQGIRQVICRTNELEIEGFRENPKNRCYICKKSLFENFLHVAKEYGMAAVVEGSNMDDIGDYRPGMIAIEELGIKSPLREAELTKAEIRELSKALKLPTWNKPSYACLATRFVYGEIITEEKLEMVDKAEQLLLDMGFEQFRVRMHDKMARIEILPDEFERLVRRENRDIIVEKFKSYGFSYVAMDLQGYRTGSMNETLAITE